VVKAPRPQGRRIAPEDYRLAGEVGVRKCDDLEAGRHFDRGDTIVVDAANVQVDQIIVADRQSHPTAVVRGGIKERRPCTWVFDVYISLQHAVIPDQGKSDEKNQRIPQ
jgi:hypothetical protein